MSNKDRIKQNIKEIKSIQHQIDTMDTRDGNNIDLVQNLMDDINELYADIDRNSELPEEDLLPEDAVQLHGMLEGFYIIP